MCLSTQEPQPAARDSPAHAAQCNMVLGDALTLPTHTEAALCLLTQEPGTRVSTSLAGSQMICGWGQGGRGSEGGLG